MKILASIKKNLRLIAGFATVALVSTLANCGGGLSGDSIIIRPRTFEGLSLAMGTASSPNAFTVEFYRSATSGSASKTGDAEEGAIIFTTQSASVSRNDGSLTAYFPTSMDATYRYTATSDNSGLLQITAKNATYQTAAGSVGNGLWLFSDLTVNSVANFIITFDNSNGASVGITNIEAYPDGFGVPAGINPFDPYTGQGSDILDATISLNGALTKLSTNNGGGPVEIGYTNDPVDGVDQESSISPASFGGRNIRFTPDQNAGDTFSVTCVVSLVDNTPGDRTETGSATVRDNTNAIIIGNNSYSYSRLLNTDSANFILTLEQTSDLENTYLLDFLTIESTTAPLTQRYTGTYRIVGGPDANDTGTFVLRDSQNVGE